MHVGNDIVDLKSPFAKDKSKDERFVKRVFTQNEQRYIVMSDWPDVMLWGLWAAKETAYKVISKTYPLISSAPAKYSVFISALENGLPQNGIVKVPGKVNEWVSFKAYHYEELVHCVGRTRLGKGEYQLRHGIKKINNGNDPNYSQSSNQVSNYVRCVATEGISELVACHKDNVVISNVTLPDGRSYPVVRINNQPNDHQSGLMDISFSHDGRYVAYAFSLRITSNRNY